MAVGSIGDCPAYSIGGIRIGMSEEHLKSFDLKKIGPEDYKLGEGKVSCVGGKVRYISGNCLEMDGHLVLESNQLIQPDYHEIFLSLGFPESPNLQGDSLSTQELNFPDLGLRVSLCRDRIHFVWLEKLQRFQPELVEATILSSADGFHKMKVSLSPEPATGGIHFAEALSVNGICPGMPVSSLGGWSELVEGFYSSGACGAGIENRAVKYVEGPTLLGPDASVLLQADQLVSRDRREIFEALRLPYPRNSNDLRRTEPVIPEIFDFEDLGVSIYLKKSRVHTVALSSTRAEPPYLDSKRLLVSIPEDLQICRKIRFAQL